MVGAALDPGCVVRGLGYSRLQEQLAGLQPRQCVLFDLLRQRTGTALNGRAGSARDAQYVTGSGQRAAGS